MQTHAFFFDVDPEGEHCDSHPDPCEDCGPINQQSSDIFTKALTGPIFECHRKRVLGQLKKAPASVTEDNRKKRPR